MKKYIIKDNLGNKKTVYADNLRHALTFVDSKVKDANRPMTFKFFINNRAVSEDEYTRSFIEEAAREHQSARTAKNVINEDKETAKSDGKSTFFFESGRKFSIIYDSKVKDEASLATSINALVTDEKAAIDSYDVAINNLKGKIDDIAMQVLINIMKDERRHVENLYAILNGQVTKKNLEDSKIVDAVQSAETYANTGWIENKLASDLINEGQKNDYDFDAVLKKFDSLSKQILAVVKNALDNARKEIVDYKSRY